MKADAVVEERAAKVSLRWYLALAADTRAWSNLFWSSAVSHGVLRCYSWCKETHLVF